ncbi:YHS domain-containing protein [Thermoflexus sp.]|uniref:YHS domain-containing protein n=1 Tax=Thermoflexus sp. TaxID=1969742 RepID=UPI0035E4344A
MAKDLVCGMEVEEAKAAATSVYKGQTYYFCSVGCKAAFDKDPEKYVGKARPEHPEAHGGLHGPHH